MSHTNHLLTTTPLLIDAHPLLHRAEHSIASPIGRFPPEPQEGNTEYKLKLICPTTERFQHLVTQMKWRLAEGGGEAVYQVNGSDS